MERIKINNSGIVSKECHPNAELESRRLVAVGSSDDPREVRLEAASGRGENEAAPNGGARTGGREYFVERCTPRCKVARIGKDVPLSADGAKSPPPQGEGKRQARACVPDNVAAENISLCTSSARTRATILKAAKRKRPPRKKRSLNSDASSPRGQSTPTRAVRPSATRSAIVEYQLEAMSAFTKETSPRPPNPAHSTSAVSFEPLEGAASTSRESCNIPVYATLHFVDGTRGRYDFGRRSVSKRVFS